MVDDDRWYEHIDLVLEPENPHDPNAIKVVYKGKTVGHVAATDIQRVKTRLFRGAEILDWDIATTTFKSELLSSVNFEVTYEPKQH